MRLYCDIEGLRDNWVDVADAWTRNELRAMLDAEGAEFLDILHAKLEACHIEAGELGVITDPNDITEEAINENIDLRVGRFLGSAMVTACGVLSSLGNASARVLSNGTDPQHSSG